MHTIAEPGPPPRIMPAAWVWTLLAMVLAALDLSFHLFHNWVSFDDGSMGLAASLVRHGAWPHRDFVDIYSGGLAVFDAGAQWLFGDDLRSLRIPFAIAALGWVGLLAACFRRFVSAPAAAGLALLAFLWGPPMYTAAMPSWYLLFLATAVIWALLRWHETQHPKWWGAAGLLIGLGLAVKINALFLLAGTGCVLLTDDRIRGGPVGTLVVILGVAGACFTVGSGWPLEAAVMLVLPLVALAAVVVWRGRMDRAELPADPRRALLPLAWLAAGVGVVVAPWVLAYALHGGLAQLRDGVLVIPFRRLEFARFVPPSFWIPDIGVAAVVLALVYGKWERHWAMLAGAAIVALAFLASEGARLHPDWGVLLGWREIRIGGIIALLSVAITRAREGGPRTRSVVIVGWIAVWFVLLQYPFAATNYFSYVAPLIILAGGAAASVTMARPIGKGLALALAIWTLGVDHGQPLNLLGHSHSSPPPALTRLDLAHGGVMVFDNEAQMYKGVVDLLDHWGAQTIEAGPDAPEIYYLSGRPFPEREFFEFMAPDWSASVFARRIIDHHPDAVVLNGHPFFSKIPVDSVPLLLPTRPIADTIIGRFRILLLRPPHPAP